MNLIALSHSFYNFLSNSSIATEFFLFSLRIVCSCFHCSAVLLSTRFKVECVILYILESKGPACSERPETHYLYAVGSMKEKT